MCVQARVAVVLAASLFALAASEGAAVADGLRIAHVDLRDYPTVELTVVTPTPDRQPPLIQENGSPAAGVQAENLGRGTSVMLAIDRSQSMHGLTLAHALSASRAFLATKPGSYRVAVMTFGSQSLQLTDFSTSTSDADAALHSIAIDPKRGTTIYDSVVLAARSLEADNSGGRVIILITDGQETTSKASLGKAIEVARRAHVIVYPIAVEDATFMPRPLRALADGTGGRMFVTAPDRSMAGAYDLIASELRRTWQVSYYTAVRPGGSIDLTVQEAAGGRARADVPIPGASANRKSSSLPFVELAIALVTLLGLGLVLGLLRVVRARSADPELY
jgi:hypothetical protein